MAGKIELKQSPRELKLKAMRMFFDEGMVKKEIIESLGRNDLGRVKVWLQKYRRMMRAIIVIPTATDVVLIDASDIFFCRYNQTPEKVLSMIGVQL